MDQATSSESIAGPPKQWLVDGQASERQCRSQILALPRELRDEIYRYAWEGTHIYYRELDWGIDARYLDANGECAEASKLPRWLLVHPQILGEGMEQFYAEAEFSAGNGEDAMPLESKLSQSSLLTITKARTLTFFSVKAFYRFDPKTYLEFLDTPTTWFEPVGFLLSDLQRDLFFQLGACNNLHHLKFVILWEPISNTKSQDLENESVEDIDAVTSLFGYVRTVEFFVALRKPWAPLKRPCGRAAMEFSEEIMCIMGSSERVPRVEFRFLQGDSMVCPWGSYWKKKYLESTHDSPLNSDFSHTFVFDIPDSS